MTAARLAGPVAFGLSTIRLHLVKQRFQLDALFGRQEAVHTVQHDRAFCCEVGPRLLGLPGLTGDDGDVGGALLDQLRDRFVELVQFFLGGTQPRDGLLKNVVDFFRLLV